MAEATSGAGGTSLEGERGKRPPPEGEPAAPASGVLDKLFGKRLLQVGRYLVSHKAWMKTVPTENCDVLMTFPDTTDDHTLLWLLNHIRVGIPELIVQVRHHRHTRAYAFFVTATYERRVPVPGLSLTLLLSSPPFQAPTARSSHPAFVPDVHQVHHP